MDRISACILAAAIVMGLASPGYPDGWSESGLCNYRRYGLDAEKFFIYMTQDTPYTSWQTWPGRTKMEKGGEPHGAFNTVYVNPAAYESVSLKEGMKYGSLIVMESFGPDKGLIQIFAKIRIKGYNPEGGDWYWFRYAPGGQALETGKVENCLGCHARMAKNDFIMTAPVR